MAKKVTKPVESGEHNRVVVDVKARTVTKTIKVTNTQAWPSCVYVKCMCDFSQTSMETLLEYAMANRILQVADPLRALSYEDAQKLGTYTFMAADAAKAHVSTVVSRAIEKLENPEDIERMIALLMVKQKGVLKG